MSNQPDEPQDQWMRKHMQALRNGIAAMTPKALGDDDVEAFAYEIIKALGLEPQDEGVDVLATIKSMKTSLATALAANHELGKSLMLMSEKYQAVAGERDGLALQLEWPDNPDFDGTDAAHPAFWRGHDYTTAIFCQHANDILGGKDEGAGANTEPWAGTRKRLLGLVGELSAIDAALARRPALGDLKTRAEKVWRACDTAASLDRRLANARGYEIRFKTLEPKLNDCEQALKSASDECVILRQQLATTGEAVKSACLEYLDSRGQSSLTPAMNRAVDVGAIIDGQEKGK